LIIDFRTVSKGKKVTIAWDPKLNEFEVEVPEGVKIKKYDEVEVII